MIGEGEEGKAPAEGEGPKGFHFLKADSTSLAKLRERLAACPKGHLEIHPGETGPLLRVVPGEGETATWDTADDLLNETFHCPPVCP